MVARVTRYRGRVEPLADGMSETRAVLATKPGSAGVEYLLDIQGGVALTISLWESTDAAEASEDWARAARERTAQTMNLTIEDVHVYDMALRAETRARA